MRIAILGTGQVGRTLGTKLAALGHEVRMGSRSADNEHAAQWAAEAGEGASHGTFADAAEFGEALFNCTAGGYSLDALRAAGNDNIEGKILVDVANPLDFSAGFPPRLTIVNDHSLGETIQGAIPGAKVVKALNTVNHEVMVDPGRLPGEHHVFVCGNDEAARRQVAGWLREWFGWQEVIDLGDISNARGTEAWLLLWARLYATFGTAEFNLSIVRGSE